MGRHNQVKEGSRLHLERYRTDRHVLAYHPPGRNGLWTPGIGFPLAMQASRPPKFTGSEDEHDQRSKKECVRSCSREFIGVGDDGLIRGPKLPPIAVEMYHGDRASVRRTER